MIIDKQRIVQCYKAYSNLNIVLFILVNIILMIITNYAISYLPFSEDLINPVATDLFENNNIVFAFFMMIIFVPIMETLIFQALIIKLSYVIFEKFKFAKRIIALLISSLLFAINHPYSITYMLTTFFVGFILALAYMAILKRKYSAILIVFLIHALYNMIPFLGEVLDL